MNISIVGIVAILLYLATGLLLALRLSHATTTQPSKLGLIAMGLIATGLHASVLYQAISTPAGFNLGFFNATSLVGWFIALLLLLAALARPVENLGIGLLPLAALTLLLAAIFPSRHLMLTDGVFTGLDAHILISILAYSLLGIAAVQALLLAIQDAHLRDRHPGGFMRGLPPLQTMETILFQIISIGFALLSLALLSGLLFLENIFAQHLVHKTLLSLLAWVVFATLLWGRWRFGWRGRTAIRWTLAGFFVLMLAYTGTKLVLEVMLGR